MSEPLATEGTPGPRTLTRHQRRVLGVLVEKAITTPNQYPLTLKGVASGCNQTSNRDPVVNYTEEQCQQYLDELRALGLVACIHTESGRTERFRHYIRKAYPFTEPQLAIMTELWLRGRQQPAFLQQRPKNRNRNRHEKSSLSSVPKRMFLPFKCNVRGGR